MYRNRLLSFFAFTCLSITAAGQGFLRADGKKMVSGDKEVILQGFGLGGWMLQEPYMLQLSGVAVAQHEIRSKVAKLIGEGKTRSFYSSWLSNHCTKTDIDSIAAWGFNSVRLPMHYNLYTLPLEEEKKPGVNTWLPVGFALTDSLLSWCKANRLFLILDLHAAPGGQGSDIPISDRDTSKPSLWDSEGNRGKTIALWEKLAERYSGEPWIGAYDILNEPNWGFQDRSDKNGCAEKENGPLRRLYKDITAAIRKHDKNHMIIIEGNCWGNNYEGMFPLWDNNMALSFHKYWNYNDEASIEKYINYREKYNVPIWLGETGENSNAWYSDMMRLMANHKIGWNLWPLKKSGINNPLKVDINPGMRKIIQYWQGHGPKPSPDEAYKSLIAFAEATNISKAELQVGVIDALTRQAASPIARAFSNTPVETNGRRYATDYDFGPAGIAYHDMDSANYWVSNSIHNKWNEGGKYRNDGVDIEACNDTITNGYYVGWIQQGEWLQYSFFAAQGGNFECKIRYSADSVQGNLTISLNDDQEAAQKVELPSTGSFTAWKSINGGEYRFIKGWNTVRIHALSTGFNLNYIEFLPTETSKN